MGIKKLYFIRQIIFRHILGGPLQKNLLKFVKPLCIKLAIQIHSMARESIQFIYIFLQFYNCQSRLYSIEQKLVVTTYPFIKNMDLEYADKKIKKQIHDQHIKKKNMLINRINKYFSPGPQMKINHICNIEDSFFINQKSLKRPQEQQESLLSTIFYFKTVSKVSVTKDYITLYLKNKNQTYLPKQYFIQRFKSFGNREFYEIAVHLEHIAKHLEQIKSLDLSEEQKFNFSIQKEQEILNQSLIRLVGKRFFTFYYEFSKQGTFLNQIIISKALLQALGYDVEKVALDFLHFREAIFQIISAKLYFLVMEKKTQLWDTIFQKMRQQILGPQQVRAITMFRFTDQLLVNSNQNGNNFQEKIKSRVKFFKSHPSVTIFQIQKMDKKSTILFEPKNKVRQENLKDYKSMIREKQIQSLKHLAVVSRSLLQQEEVQKICGYRELDPMAMKQQM